MRPRASSSRTAPRTANNVGDPGRESVIVSCKSAWSLLGLSQTSEHGVRDVAPSSSPPGCELADRAVQHDENGEWQLAIECYVRAADEFEAFANSGQPAAQRRAFAHHVEAYRTELELTQDYSQEIAAQPGNNSAAASVSATASSMFQKFKSTAAKAASKTKETAIIVGNTAKSAANSAYTAAGTRGTFANKVVDGVERGLGPGFGWTLGRTAAHAVSDSLFPAPLRRRRWC